jgi:hypothetical protein
LWPFGFSPSPVSSSSFLLLSLLLLVPVIVLHVVIDGLVILVGIVLHAVLGPK